jgi:hypothetical protein
MDEYFDGLVCSKCKEYKSLEEFSRDSRAKSRNYKSYSCKECDKEDYYESDPEKYRENHIEELIFIFDKIGYDTSTMKEERYSIHQQFLERHQELFNKPKPPKEKKTRNRKKDDPNYKPMREWTAEERREYYRKYVARRRNKN